jgi:hypothetical protein
MGTIVYEYVQLCAPDIERNVVASKVGECGRRQRTRIALHSLSQLDGTDGAIHTGLLLVFLIFSVNDPSKTPDPRRTRTGDNPWRRDARRRPRGRVRVSGATSRVR